MNVRLLIEAIVRQTTILIAQLATSGGLRAPLAHIAGQVFLDLAKELEAQGVPSRVRADMFGMALRTYQRHTHRIAQSQTDRGRSLWEAVYEFLKQRSIVSRDDLFDRFSYDDEGSLRGVLRDLTESGLVFSSGSGRGVVYRLATDDELGSIRRSADRSSLDAFVWNIVYVQGPASLQELESVCRIPVKELELILSSLIAAGRVERNEVGGESRYRSREFVVALEDPTGWEGAVLDHFSACVKTIGRKLSIDQQATLRDEVGGSTYHFVLWRGHPMESEVLGELGRFRGRMSALRDRIDRFNSKHGIPSEHLKVDAYYGQCVVEEDDALDEATEAQA